MNEVRRVDNRTCWVYLDGRPGVNVWGSLDDTAAIGVAERYWREREYIDRIAADLRERHHTQVYEGHLPTPDTIWRGRPGRYVYVLGRKRKGGMWEVAEAIPLTDEDQD